MFPPTLVIGSLRVAWYSLIMTGGLLAALLWLAWSDAEHWRVSAAGSDERLSGKRPLRSHFLHLTPGWPAALRRALDDALPLLLSGLVGGRVVYVLAQWPYFGEHPWQSLRFWEGGLSAQGALAGGLLLLIWQARTKPGGWTRADRFVPPLLVLQTAAWFSCWCAACAFGRTVDIARWPWLAAFDWPDLYGLFLPRVPVQGMGAVVSLLLLAGAWRLRARNLAPGLLSGAALFLGALADAGLQLLRGDEAWLWLGQRAALWADLVFILCGATCIVWAWRKRLAQTPLSC